MVDFTYVSILSDIGLLPKVLIFYYCESFFSVPRTTDVLYCLLCLFILESAMVGPNGFQKLS